MTRKELMNDLKSKIFVEKIEEGKNPTNEAIFANENRRIYEVWYREVDGKVCREPKIHILVIDEGTDKEKAYYMENEPTQTII